MKPHFDKEPDALDELLAAPQPPADAEALRQKLLSQTTGVLRFRRRVRQATWAAGLAACVAAVVFGFRGRPPAPVAPQPEVSDLPAPPAPDESALALEWRAFDSPNRQAELYRQAGDRYLTEGEDLQAALRCYANALDTATDDDQKVSPSDSWLLMAIKDAREKEKRDANGM
jgi:negative regulator of sigma E activity